MTLKEYLETLSKEKLISLLMDLSGTNTEVRNYLTEKWNTIQIQLKQNEKQTLSSDTLLHQTHSINRQSSPQEKINLFKTLFSGRQDVFALRWFNAKSNKSGYSPVCGNKWLSGKCDLKKYSCATCPYKLPVALTDNYIYNHLAGKDEFCRDVIGLYPLMEGNFCRFLAMDFDAHAPKAQMSITSSHANGAIATYSHAPKEQDVWKDDILAVHKTFSDFGINSYIEISRSGNGGHLWIFFEETISARLARNLGTAIIKAAMQNRHSISFESFDRFFPNQDEIPKGGYGNLIALPLQGRAVKEGHSVFVDESFIPYEDQWAFLSSVQTVSERVVKKTISEIENTLTDFIEKDESENTTKKNYLTYNISQENKESLNQSDFSTTVKIILSNYIQIQKNGISEKALGVLRRTAVILNPEYFKNLRMHLPLYNIPRYIDCSKENEDYLLLPRGNLSKVIEKIEEAKVEYEITDERETGQEIDLHFNAELYDEQKDALKELLKEDVGILSAGTGFGKTVVASSLIAKRKINTLILVQSHALLEQWKKAIKQFLDFTPGTIAAGKDKSNGIVDIAIVNSLIEKGSDEVRPRSYKYGMLIVDECHHVSAFSTENLVSSFKAKYVYGLTATPIRRDGHQKIIFYQCGSVLYSTTTKQMNEAQNFSHYFIPRFSSFHYVPELAESDSKNPSINQYYGKLIANSARNNLIIEDVKNAVLQGRTPLILSERIEQLNLLHEQLSDSAQNVIFITGHGTQKQKKEVLEKLRAIPSDESLIILATGKYAGEGFDYPRIDTLMLAMPFSWKGTLAQYCGRLHRNFAGKNEVQIYDYVDYRIPVFDRMYQNRLKGYKHLGYSIKPNTSDNVETNTQSKLYSVEDYKSDFQKDILSATSKIIISVPYLSKNEVQDFVLTTTPLLVKGVNIKILLRNPDDESKQKKLEPCISMLENFGVKVIEQENVSQKISIIDEKILWYGNINFLGYTENEECCMRIVDNKIASEIDEEVLNAR